ncbi:MAG: glycosyltransferase family 2 protein [Nanoarchaeota archaeon]|nr:glycosyltransferase family 2 protein [Nanoarchaeota archaeon]
MISIIILCLLYFFLFLSCFWVIVFLDNLDVLWEDPNPKKKYQISVIIPAYNEEKNITKSIESTLSQNYPRELFEVIVVNDGSNDATRRICESYVKKGLIRLFNKKNGGKASAMNLGIRHAKGELIFILDADSKADKNCFNNLIGYFNNSKVAAVTSSMTVTSKKTFLQKIQWVEYLFSILMRKIMSLFNCLHVTPGPGSIYRKSIIQEIGGFSEKTLTEDMEIAFNIQDKGYIIENSLNSVVLTNTPEKIADLIRQRRRWYTGFIEDSSSYKHFFFNKNKGFLGAFLLPSNVFGTFALLFLSFYSIFLLGKNFFKTLTNFNSINFNLLTVLKFPELSNFFYGINIFSIISIILLAMSLILVYYSLRTSNVKIDLKNNFWDYVSYLLFYSILMTLFWVDSIFYKLFFRTNSAGWRYGKKEALN